MDLYSPKLKQAAKKLAVVERDFNSLKADYLDQKRFVLSFEERNQITLDRDRLEELEAMFNKLPDDLKKRLEQQICKEDQFPKEER
jgi:hypothetical protein